MPELFTFMERNKMRYVEKIFDVKTNEETIIERDFTSEELIQIQEIQSKAEAERIESEKRSLARQAILDRLGLTEEEAKLLLS